MKKKLKKKRPLNAKELAGQIAQYKANLQSVDCTERARDRANRKLVEIESLLSVVDAIDPTNIWEDCNGVADMFGFDKILFSEGALRNAYSNKKRDAKDRGIKFTLSFETFTAIKTSKTCYYTGKKFKTADEVSIDRLNNDRGYEDDNVVACLTSLNTAKTDLTIDEIIAMHKRIVNRKQTIVNTLLNKMEILLLHEKITTFKAKKSILEFNPFG